MPATVAIRLVYFTCAVRHYALHRTGYFFPTIPPLENLPRLNGVRLIDRHCYFVCGPTVLMQFCKAKTTKLRRGYDCLVRHNGWPLSFLAVESMFIGGNTCCMVKRLKNAGSHLCWMIPERHCNLRGTCAYAILHFRLQLLQTKNAST